MFYYINVVQSDNYYKKDCLSASYIWDPRGINLQAVLKSSSAAGETQHQGSCCTSRTLKLIFFRTSSSRSGFPWSDWLPVFKQRWRKKKKKKKKVAWPKKKNLTCLVGTWSNQTSKINHNFISHCFTSNAHPIWINKYSTEWHYFGEYHFTVPGTRRHPNREELRGKLNWAWQKPRLLKWLVCLYSPWQRETALWHRRLLNASQVLLSATEVQQGCSCAAL